MNWNWLALTTIRFSSYNGCTDIELDDIVVVSMQVMKLPCRYYTVTMGMKCQCGNFMHTD